jgi:predicted alpha/beta-hydrolase family hydrolase
MTTAAEVPTPVGPACTVTEGPARGTPTLVLGHGAGGGIDAPDLLAARDGALAAGLRVVRVEQPWRVRGGKVAEAPARLDLAWTAVLAQLPGPLVVGGRSAGARVACRTAQEVGALAVLALAFPLHPPGRPERSRVGELQAPPVPRLVVQGDRDAFGLPEPGPGVQVHVVRGADHGFAVRRRDGRTGDEVLGEVRETVAHWLEQLVQTLT